MSSAPRTTPLAMNAPEPHAKEMKEVAMPLTRMGHSSMAYPAVSVSLFQLRPRLHSRNRPQQNPLKALAPTIIWMFWRKTNMKIKHEMSIIPAA